MPRSVFLSKQLIKNDTDRLTLISGPCLLENEKLVRQVAKSLIKYAKKEKFNLIFKCSFDKANRSSDQTIRNKISFDKSLDILKNLKNDLKISITDDGLGFSKDIIDKLGEPYISKNSQGMGLGIFIAKNLIENMGGKINLYNSKEDNAVVEIIFDNSILNI